MSRSLSTTKHLEVDFGLVDSTCDQLNKNSFSEKEFPQYEVLPNLYKRPFRVHLMWGYHFIVLDDKVHPSEGKWYVQELQSNGDIYLRLVDIFSSENKSRPQVSQQADDYTEGLHHHV